MSGSYSSPDDWTLFHLAGDAKQYSLKCASSTRRDPLTSSPFNPLVAPRPAQRKASTGKPSANGKAKKRKSPHKK